MSWHYRVRKRMVNGEKLFDIVEMYTKPRGWTKDGMKPVGNSKKEIIRDLEMMLGDAKKYSVLDEGRKDVRKNK